LLHLALKSTKQKCTGCRLCIHTCPGVNRIGHDRKPEIVDQDKPKECEGENFCPFGAIDKISEESE